MTPRGLRVLALSVILGGTTVLLSGCSWSEVIGLGWPEGITPEAHVNRELWVGSLIAALVVGVIVWGLIFWSSAFHRHKKGDTELPRQFGYQKVNFGDGSFTFDGVDNARKAAMESKPEGVDKHGEEIVGAVRGLNPEDRTYLNFDKVETLGSSTEIPILVLPIGKRIEFQIASADVIHAFWVPEFLFKRDVMPDPQANHSDNVFQVSEINKTGAFVGRCAEMCGTYHSMMNFEVRVVEPNDFKVYLQQRMAGKTNAEALQAINQPPTAVTTHPFDTRRGEQAGAASQASK